MTIQPLAVPLPATAAFSEAAIRALPSDDKPEQQPAWLDDLRNKGFAVVPNLVPQERCDAYVDDALTWLEDFGLGFKRDDKKTWHKDKLPIHHKGGLYNRYCEYLNAGDGFGRRAGLGTARAAGEVPRDEDGERGDSEAGHGCRECYGQPDGSRGVQERLKGHIANSAACAHEDWIWRIRWCVQLLHPACDPIPC